MVEDFRKHRWQRKMDPADFSPRDALIEALRQLDDPNENLPDEHVILIFGGSGADGRARFRFLQAGGFDEFAQIGLMRLAMREMEEDE